MSAPAADRVRVRPARGRVGPVLRRAAPVRVTSKQNYVKTFLAMKFTTRIISYYK